MELIDYMRNGRTVKLRNGDVMLIVGDQLVSYDDGFLWFDEDNYDFETLKDADGEAKYDIMEIHDTPFSSLKGWNSKILINPLWIRVEKSECTKTKLSRPVRLSSLEARRLLPGDKVMWYGCDCNKVGGGWVGEIAGKGTEGVAVCFEKEFAGHRGGQDHKFNAEGVQSWSKNIGNIRYDDGNLFILI